MEESDSPNFEDFQEYAFELQVIAKQSFNPARIKEYLSTVYNSSEKGELELCQKVFNYVIVVLSKYLQMMVAYHIFQEDTRKVAKESCQNIVKELITFTANIKCLTNFLFYSLIPKSKENCNF